MGCFWVYFDIYTTLMLGKARFKDERPPLVKKNTGSIVFYETMKYFNAEKYETERCYNAVDKRQMAEYRYLLYRVLSGAYKLAFFMVSFLAISLMTAYRVSQGHLSVGQFMSLITYMLQLRSSLDFVAGVSQSFQALLIHSEKTLRLLQKHPTVVDDPQAVPLTTCRGEIRFEKAKFSYAGTTTALVGETGAVKSTVLRLLFRFYDLQEGCIFIDGNSVHNITIESIRRQIGVVPQEAVLFNDTLMYNLKYANQDARDEDVYEACRAAGIHDIIMKFPDGYATEVGERGLALSGGERKRVTIARTILKGTKTILLDEATASLDTNTEEHVQKSLASLAHGRTTIVVAHRLSTVTEADCILVFHEGEVVERGTHQELIKLNGRYASMWRKQTREHTNVQNKEETKEETEEEIEEETEEATKESKVRS
ncbi:hypothetical protein N7513_003597 [Penicillium frequentans]|nr:hypothetical protein N7513_003597 [Penicillium glabrum]